VNCDTYLSKSGNDSVPWRRDRESSFSGTSYTFQPGSQQLALAGQSCRAMVRQATRRSLALWEAVAHLSHQPHVNPGPPGSDPCGPINPGLKVPDLYHDAPGSGSGRRRGEFLLRLVGQYQATLFQGPGLHRHESTQAARARPRTQHVRTGALDKGPQHFDCDRT